MPNQLHPRGHFHGPGNGEVATHETVLNAVIVGLGRNAKGERCGGQEALKGAERPEWSHGEIPLMRGWRRREAPPGPVG